MFSAILALIELAGILFRWLDRQGMMSEVRKELLAEQLMKLAEENKVVDKIRSRVDSLSDAAVDEELRRAGDYRDQGLLPEGKKDTGRP